MSQTDEHLWRDLHVGDRIQIVHFPCEFSEHEYTMHEETRDVYKHLIESGLVLEVSELDSDGCPWVRFEITTDQGEIENHALMLNHDGVQRAIATN